MSAPAAAFDYESKTWGGAPVFARPWYLQGLKLRYALEALCRTRGVIVDVGCGAGNMAKAIKRERPDMTVLGVDVSRPAIETARREPGGVEFKVAEADLLPCADGSVEAVTMFDVLEHVPDPDGALAEVSRILRPNGVFHVSLPLEDQPWTLYPSLYRRGWRAKERHCGHLRRFSAASFQASATSAGLVTRQVRWSFHPLFQLVDVAYYAMLDLRGPARQSVEDYVLQQRGPRAAFFKAGKAVVATAGWCESWLFAWLPGGNGHFTCHRR